MTPVNQALTTLSTHLHDYKVESIILPHSVGRILCEDIHADHDFPPFDRVSMDGIAIRFETFEKGKRNFKIAGMAAAGSPQQSLRDSGHCLEIMTGSILPIDADTIIPYEWLNISNGMATITKENVKRGQNVHFKGKDRKEGELIIPSGRLISPTEIGVLASVGKSYVIVSKLPSVMIISTGNELVAIDQAPLPHQVRMSNVHQLHACLQQLKINPDTTHLQDDYDAIKESLEKIIASYDIVIISGGISEGKFDFIPEALESLGVHKHFYKVKQRPGKPFWFGTHASGCTVFGIPGNPVSSFLCFVRYIKPWLKLCLQQQPSPPQLAKLSEDVSFIPDLTYFITVRLIQNENGELIAIPSPGHGSGDLSNLVNADGFLELPAEREVFRKGEVFSYFEF